MAYSHIFMKCIGFRGASWDGPLFFLPVFCPVAPSPAAQTDRLKADRRREKMGQPVADSTFFFVILHDTYFYIDTIMYRCIFIFITRGPSWDAPLFFLPVFCPVAPSPAARQTDTGRQAERGKITPWNVASGIFFVTLCDLRYVLLIFCIINLLNYFFSIFLMFRGPSWDAPLFFLPVTLSHPVLPLIRTDARKRREKKNHGTIANDIIFCNFVLV